MIVVFVDTTATFVDVTMTSTRWMQALTLCARGELRIVMPEVVLLETARHWFTQAAEAISTGQQRLDKIESSRERFARLGLDSSDFPSPSTITSTADKQKFESETRLRLLTLGVEIEPVPTELGINEVLERDLSGRQPFQASGKGFRDTLIWETLKSQLATTTRGDVAFFITDNASDYCDSSGELSLPLKIEIESVGATLKLVKSLDELMSSDTISPLAADLARSDDELSAFLLSVRILDEPEQQRTSVGSVVWAAVQRACEHLYGDEVEAGGYPASGHDFSPLDIPHELDGLTIATIETDEELLNWQTYETYDDTTLLIRAEVVADVELDGFAYKGDALHLENRVHVLDWDWNDHMAHVVTSVRANLIFQVRVERGLEQAEECELESVEPA